MTRRVVIIGAGMGGLTTAVRLARKGLSVRVIEARTEAGGLASGFEKDGLRFDAGPYVLLDRPGLEWAFRALGLELADHISLRRIDDVYEVSSSAGVTVRFHGDLKKTAEGFDAQWPGSGKLYEDFVAATAKTHGLLSPLLHVSRPRPSHLLADRRFTRIPFLLQSLGSILARTNLPLPVVEAIAIWTQIAGQRMDTAPSPLAFVPALIHSVGAFYTVDGIATIPRALEGVAKEAGVEFQYGTRVRKIVCERGSVSGVETNEGDFVRADAIVSNYSGIGTYTEMLEETPPRAREKLSMLPLQSPGACAYLAVRGDARQPYLRFRTSGAGELCRLLVMPVVVAPELKKNGWFPARLISPMRHDEAERLGVEGQRDYLDQLIQESWWREGIDDYRVVDTRVPAEWGTQYNLYRDSMNPVMTAGFMRAGRLAHRSPHARGLYLAGSSTHPGQWVSFCAISGILAADDLLEDLK
ncbi:MAG TPA: NAD(P)/FAD-dependent oxidoreductase [Pyrinomonadaceae bacterium]|nr:NAD(P)/FAD-dependent oxidoreductase [Pyrinomonadaceae bacterium]